MKSKYLYIVILALIGIIIFIEVTKPTPPDLNEYIKIGGKEYILLSSKIDTVYVVDTLEIPAYKPYPVPGPIVEVEIPIDVDTTAILKDYFSKYYYKDVVPLDEIGTATIMDTVSTNKIISRRITFDYSIPVITETVTVKDKPVNKIYLGFGAATDASVYAGGLFKTKKDKVFGLNLGFASQNSTITPYVGGSIYWKLKFGK